MNDPTTTTPTTANGERPRWIDPPDLIEARQKMRAIFQHLETLLEARRKLTDP